MATTSKALRIMAASTAAMVVVLMLVGGLVTTTETGDTIPTWPHWRGQLKGGMWIEMSHRFLGMIAGVMAIALAVLARNASPWLRRLAWIALAGVVVQGLLGFLRVRFPHEGPSQAVTAIIHAVFAQVVFCAVVAVSVGQSRAWELRGAGDARGVGVAATAACLLQLVAGAVARHTGIGFEVHAIGAVAVLVLASLLASRLLMTPLRRGAWTLTVLLLSQIALGVLTWALTRHAGFERGMAAPAGTLLLVSAHVVLGAGLLAACLCLTLLSGPGRKAPRLGAVAA
ncbi:MAG TPA: COX15/CtaA family protein [Planctomycetota bacterium]